VGAAFRRRDPPAPPRDPRAQEEQLTANKASIEDGNHRMSAGSNDGTWGMEVGTRSAASPWSCMAAACLCAGLLAPGGCKSLGPPSVRRDRLHYAAALADSRKEQLLLNIVRLRHGDPPAFLDVVSVVSGYSLETDVSVGGQFSPESLRGDTFAGAGLSAKYTDRPTISYAPLMGEKFARSLMSPVPLDALILFGLEGSMPADFLHSNQLTRWSVVPWRISLVVRASSYVVHPLGARGV
jgi:hypothetical protein